MLLGTTGALPAAAHHPSVTEYQTGLSTNAGPWDLVDGGDGRIWFTEDALSAFGPLSPGDGLISEVTGKLHVREPARDHPRSRRQAVDRRGRRQRAPSPA